MRYLGTSYYPESWGLDRIAVDIKLMKDAGMNMVRLGEFAWSKMEKKEGEYDFELFRKSIDMFAEHQINVMMCTPTAAPPAWLAHDYPETLVVDATGNKAIHGIRQHCCYNSKLFRKFSNKIADKLTKSLADCTNILIWQVDNELGQRLVGACSCDTCQNGFREYLKEKYGTLDNLNHCWKNEFWSQDYSDWDQIILAFPEPLWNKSPKVIHYNYAASRVLDSMRYYDIIVKEYLTEQVKVIRKNIPQTKITTNNPCGVFNLNFLYEDLDCTAADFYWCNRNTDNMSLRLSTYRSFKRKSFLVAETGFYSEVYPNAESTRKEARLDMWRSFAHGAISYLIFRWRPPLGGQEQTATGMVSPSGKPRKNYQVVSKMFNEVNALRSELDDIKLPKANVALMVDSDVYKNYMRHGWGSTINYDKVIGNVYQQMHSRNIAADIVSPQSSFSQYRLLILPSQRITHQFTTEQIREFIRAGGTVWAIAECHTADENGNFTLDDCPVDLTDEFGITIETGAITREETRIIGQLGLTEIDEIVSNSCWIADIDKKPETESLLKFATGPYQDQDMMTYHQFEGGHVFYQGISNPGIELFEKIAEFVIDKTRIDYFKGCPKGVEIIDCEKTVFIINNTKENVSFKYPIKGKAIRGSFDSQNGFVKLDAQDICIIKSQTGS